MSQCWKIFEAAKSTDGGYGTLCSVPQRLLFHRWPQLRELRELLLRILQRHGGLQVLLSRIWAEQKRRWYLRKCAHSE